jgi:ATP-binding cassette, subfamily B, bacterial
VSLLKVSEPTRERTGVLSLYGELWQLARGQRHNLILSCLLLIGAQCVLLGAPFFAARAINVLQLQGAEGLREAGMWLSMMLVLAVGSWVLHGPARVLERNVALHVRQRNSASLIERVLALPMSWHESHHSGATAHRIQQSTSAISSFAQSQHVYLNSAVRLVGPVAALWCIEPVVAYVALTGFAVICVSVVGFDRAMIRLARLENAAEREYSSTLIDALGNSTTLYALRQARGVVSMLDRRLRAVFEPLKRLIVLNEWKWCTVDLATRALSCGLVGFFAWRVSRGSGGAGQALMLGSLYMVWEYAVQASGVIASIAQHFQSFARQHADYSSADVIRDAAVPPAVSGTPVAAAAAELPWQRLEIHDATFRHPASRGESPTVDNVSFTLERGKRYALIGDSGSGKSTLLRVLAGLGKSTLLRVLAGLYTCERISIGPKHGNVVASPAETARYFRSIATLIPQDAEVFAGTLADNLSLCESLQGAPSSQEFARALAVSAADRFVDASDDGLNRPIAERGANWSGGQRSRIALARGVLAATGSSIVLLDEPTAHLDSATEAHVYSAMFEMFADACVISSVHRLHLLDRFDYVLMMRAGRLIAWGTPLEIACTSQEFRELVNAHRTPNPEPPPTQAPEAAAA